MVTVSVCAPVGGTGAVVPFSADITRPEHTSLVPVGCVGSRVVLSRDLLPWDNVAHMFALTEGSGGGFCGDVLLALCALKSD